MKGGKWGGKGCAGGSTVILRIAGRVASTTSPPMMMVFHSSSITIRCSRATINAAPNRVTNGSRSIRAWLWLEAPNACSSIRPTAATSVVQRIAFALRSSNTCRNEAKKKHTVKPLPRILISTSRTLVIWLSSLSRKADITSVLSNVAFRVESSVAPG